MKILVIEDDLKIASFIVQGLEDNGFACEAVHDGIAGLERAFESRHDLIITDLMLPRLDGIEVIKKLRMAKNNTPILILSAKRSVDDRVLGLQKGSDDYLTKPFAFAELLVRVQALLRRSTSAPSENADLLFEDLKLNLLTREVVRAGKKIELQAKEFSLLEYFMKNPGRVLSKTDILEKVWNYKFDPQTNVVDVLVYRLRNKIDKGFSPNYIHTLRGIGYSLRKE